METQSVKLIKISAQEDPILLTFDGLYERYRVYIANEARKAKESWLWGDVMSGVDDIEQELLMVLFNAYNEYDIQRGVAFTTFWDFKKRGYRSHKTSAITRQKRGGYEDENGKMQTVKHGVIEFTAESGEILPILDPSLEEESFENVSILVETLKDFKTKNTIESALIDNMVSQNFNNIQQLADDLGVSRQYVNVVKNKLMLRLQKEIGDI